MARKSPASSLAVLVVLSGLWCLAGPARSSQYDEEFLQVGHLSFLGNDHFSEGDLRGRIRTQVPSLFHPFRRSVYRRDFIRGDVEFLKAYYRRHGYLDVAVEDQVTVDPASRRVDVTFLISEGTLTYLGDIRYMGTTLLGAEELENGPLVRSGEPLNPFAVEAERRRVLGLFADRGYYPGSSVTSDSTPGRPSVTFRFIQGPPTRVRQVRVLGLAHNHPNLVDREMSLQAGSLLKRRDVEEDRSRLFDTDLFQEVQINVRADSTADTLVDLEVRVGERKAWWLEAGTGYGSHDNARLSAETGTRSLLWAGKRLRLATTLSFGKHPWVDSDKFEVQESRSEISYLEPWFLRSRTRAQLSLYYQIQSDTTVPRFVRGASFTLKRDISHFSRVAISFDHRGNTPHPQVLGADSISQFAGRGTRGYITRKLELSFERDLRDNAFDPSHGNVHSLALDVAGGLLGGQTAFHRETDNFSTYRPLSAHGWILAMRIRAGLVTPFNRQSEDSRPSLELLRAEDRFYTGGASSVRGYSQDEIGGQQEALDRGPENSNAFLGGRVQIVGNIEVRYPIWGLFSGAAFLDGGGVWRSPEELSLKSFAPYTLRGPESFQRFRYAAGAGIRVNTPVGPFRVDYGVKLNPPEVPAEQRQPRASFHFSLGQAF